MRLTIKFIMHTTHAVSGAQCHGLWRIFPHRIWGIIGDLKMFALNFRAGVSDLRLIKWLATKLSNLKRVICLIAIVWVICRRKVIILIIEFSLSATYFLFIFFLPPHCTARSLCVCLCADRMHLERMRKQKTRLWNRKHENTRKMCTVIGYNCRLFPIAWLQSCDALHASDFSLLATAAAIF